MKRQYYVRDSNGKLNALLSIDATGVTLATTCFGVRITRSEAAAAIRSARRSAEFGVTIKPVDEVAK